MKGFMRMKEALVDISVLLIFFTRHEQFAQVFEQVRKAKPSRLFLYQDGPRPGRQDDIINIKKCRAIAENIDWDCEVYRFYQEENYGCDPSGYIAQTWAFSQTDKCIVIEDDVVPTVSFFKFCKELLDEYENDARISLITGLNIDEQTNYCPYDYFFSSTTFTVGCWASWSRVVSRWDNEYTHLDSPYYSQMIRQYIEFHKFSKGFIPSSKIHKSSGKEHFETIMISNQYLNNGLTIIPTKNMVLNIGLTGDATHTSVSFECLPKGYRKLFELKTYDIKEKINFQKYVVEDFSYKERAYRLYGWRNPIIKISRQIETIILSAKHGNLKETVTELTRKIQKLKSKTVS